MAPAPRRQRERAVEPHRVAAANQVASREIAGRQIVVAGDGDERPPETPGHVLDEPGLAAAGRPLEHQRQAARVAGLEDGDFVAGRQVERRLGARVAQRPSWRSPPVCSRWPQDARRMSRRSCWSSAPLGTGASDAARCRGARKKKSHRNSADAGGEQCPGRDEHQEVHLDLRLRLEVSEARGCARGTPDRSRPRQTPSSCRTCRRPAARTPTARSSTRAATRHGPSAPASRR